MAMDTAAFINSLSSYFCEDYDSDTPDAVKDEAREKARKIADLIDSYIRDATVEVTIMPGTVAVGAGVAAAPNPVPIKLTGSTASGTGGLS